MTVVRAAVTQVAWTGDKQSMIERHEQLARKAAADGVQVIGFQELFYGPYFGSIQDQKYYSYVEPIPGPTVERFQPARRRAADGHRAADLRGRQRGRVLQHRSGHRRRRHHCSARTASTTSRTCRSSGRSSTSGRATSAIRSSTPPSAGSASTSATTGTSRRAGANSASTTRSSCSTRPRPSPVCRTGCGRSSSPPPRRPTSTSSRRTTASGRRPASSATRRRTSTAPATSSIPRGNFVGDIASQDKEEIVVRDLDFDEITRARNDWQFYRDRRPESYAKTTAP